MWQPIDENTPKNLKVLVAYQNKFGNWCRVMATYYRAGTLEDADDNFETDDGYAPEGWYENCESQKYIYRTDEPPVLWHELPALPEPPK